MSNVPIINQQLTETREILKMTINKCSTVTAFFHVHLMSNAFTNHKLIITYIKY